MRAAILPLLVAAASVPATTSAEPSFRATLTEVAPLRAAPTARVETGTLPLLQGTPAAPPVSVVATATVADPAPPSGGWCLVGVR